jgi:voltage-gated potassium channel
MNYLINIFRLFTWVFRLPRVAYPNRNHYKQLIAIVLRIRLALGLILISLTIGTIGYHLIEGASWFDSYYMSIITLSTIGYEEVIDLGTAGRIFNSFLIIFNLGLFAYAISSISSIFADGGFRLHFMEFNMNQNISRLKDHTIVCGFGRHAILTCEELAKQQIPFVVIEFDPEKIEDIRKNTEYLFIEGDATEDEILLEAGIANANALVVTLPADADNLFVVMSARQLNPKLRIISRANNTADEIKIKRAGADHVVIPERIGGFYMATLVNKPDLVEFFTLLSNMGPGQVVFEEIKVDNLQARFRDKTIEESKLDKEGRLPIVAVRYPSGNYQLNPLPNTVLSKGMDIVVLGDPAQMKQFKSIALGGEKLSS